MGIIAINPLKRDQERNQLAIKAERTLAQRAGEGDREAFQEIVNSNKQRMFTIARSVLRDPALAEDVVQEAFIKAYRALPEFRGDSQLSTWLHRITYLSAIDSRRQVGRSLPMASGTQFDNDIADESVSGHGEAAVAASQLQQEIESALTTLSPFEQTVFTLRHMQNFKLREIAEVVDRSEGTVKNILFRAIRKMRDQLATTQQSIQEIETC